MSDAGNRLLLDTARKRLVVHQAGQVRTCIEALNDGQMWWRANEESNAVGNLVLHLCGSTRLYIGHGVGGNGYRRDRDAEFAEPGPLPKEDLLALAFAGHAGVDLLHGAGILPPESMPPWYATACAVYDVGVAGVCYFPRVYR